MNTTPAFAVVTAAVTTTHSTEEITVMVGLTAGEAVRLVEHDDTNPITVAVQRALPRVGMVWVNGWEFSEEEAIRVERERTIRSRMVWEDNR